jgi:hypothetical protein
VQNAMLIPMFWFKSMMFGRDLSRFWRSYALSMIEIIDELNWRLYTNNNIHVHVYL